MIKLRLVGNWLFTNEGFAIGEGKAVATVFKALGLSLVHAGSQTCAASIS
ncbi:hypothetical protein [Stutzerimonas azotifigens]|uniref:Uncharacterized protein n=1 Tax=Stutzerimonas azotifigens TaxID=291995 RepID=A0ABR5YXS5_9GAMM|nr:hypothetical protein [Stutzerimonas azotifigens]MBA1272696.1 hypothetical protein [Stutzerimonas azotifigens]